MDDDLLETSVLIVDDSAFNIRVLSNIIFPLGYKVFIAKSGKQALNLIGKCCPSLVIMDVAMPEMNGFECFEEMQKDNAHIPVIFVSGSHDMKDISKAQSLGACSYLTKPVDPNTLTEQLKLYTPFS